MWQVAQPVFTQCSSSHLSPPRKDWYDCPRTNFFCRFANLHWHESALTSSIDPCTEHATVTCACWVAGSRWVWRPSSRERAFLSTRTGKRDECYISVEKDERKDTAEKPVCQFATCILSAVHFYPLPPWPLFSALLANESLSSTFTSAPTSSWVSCCRQSPAHTSSRQIKHRRARLGHPGTPRAVGNTWCTRHMAKQRPQVGRVCYSELALPRTND